jgi:phosphopantothenoylcysteine decarboxylase/phosphopantothenate--cysteine ligase
VAAVADWRVAGEAAQKIKKGTSLPVLTLTENPDILAGLCGGPNRPALVVGFAAETQDVLPHAQAKLARKGADWIVANDVSGDVMGGSRNSVHIVRADGVESLPDMPKTDVAHALVERIALALDR